MFPSLSRAFMSMLTPGVVVATESIYSSTGSSAHRIAKWSRVVPSSGLAGPRPPVPVLEVSLMALKIAAVSPFLKDSKRRNVLTDCSIEAAFSEAGGVTPTEGVDIIGVSLSSLSSLDLSR